MKHANDRERMFLSDLLNSKLDDITAELEAYQDESANFEQPEDMQDIINEMEQDIAICQSIIKKIQ